MQDEDSISISSDDIPSQDADIENKEEDLNIENIGNIDSPKSIDSLIDNLTFRNLVLSDTNIEHSLIEYLDEMDSFLVLDPLGFKRLNESFINLYYNFFMSKRGRAECGVRFLYSIEKKILRIEFKCTVNYLSIEIPVLEAYEREGKKFKKSKTNNIYYTDCNEYIVDSKEIRQMFIRFRAIISKFEYVLFGVSRDESKLKVFGLNNPASLGDKIPRPYMKNHDENLNYYQVLANPIKKTYKYYKIVDPFLGNFESFKTGDKEYCDTFSVFLAGHSRLINLSNKTHSENFSSKDVTYNETPDKIYAKFSFNGKMDVKSFFYHIQMLFKNATRTYDCDKTFVSYARSEDKKTYILCFDFYSADGVHGSLYKSNAELEGDAKPIENGEFVSFKICLGYLVKFISPYIRKNVQQLIIKIASTALIVDVNYEMMSHMLNDHLIIYYVTDEEQKDSDSEEN